MHIVEIPGTKYIALGDDLNLTPQAIEAKTIKLETHIAALDCVMALSNKDHVLDIGAYIGDTALIFLDHTKYVSCFEPQDDAFFCLNHNSPDSHNYKVAVGDGSLVVRNQDAMNGNLGTRTVQKSDEGEPSIRLDDMMFFPPPTFLKLDTEGTEPMVLDGAKKLIAAYKPKMLIEVYPEMMARQGFVVDDIYNRLREMGYGYSPAIGNQEEPRWDLLATYTRAT